MGFFNRKKSKPSVATGPVVDPIDDSLPDDEWLARSGGASYDKQ